METREQRNKREHDGESLTCKQEIKYISKRTMDIEPDKEEEEERDKSMKTYGLVHCLGHACSEDNIRALIII